LKANPLSFGLSLLTYSSSVADATCDRLTSLCYQDPNEDGTDDDRGHVPYRTPEDEEESKNEDETSIPLPELPEPWEEDPLV
jgi:hypothetical protein